MKERAGCSTGGSNQAPTEQAPATVNNVAGTSRGGKSFLQRARGKVIRWIRKSLGRQHQHQVSSKLNSTLISGFLVVPCQYPEQTRKNFH
jgi:hypothetical protein